MLRRIFSFTLIALIATLLAVPQLPGRLVFHCQACGQYFEAPCGELDVSCGSRQAVEPVTSCCSAERSGAATCGENRAVLDEDDCCQPELQPGTPEILRIHPNRVVVEPALAAEPALDWAPRVDSATSSSPVWVHRCPPPGTPRFLLYQSFLI